VRAAAVVGRLDADLSCQAGQSNPLGERDQRQ
jgi:hypothetical protein